MSYAYGDLRSSRNHFRDPQGLQERATSGIASIFTSFQRGLKTRPANGGASSKPRKSLLRRVFSLGNVLILIWIYTIYWGERISFNSSINACDWRHWESWVCMYLFRDIGESSLTQWQAPEAQPHHVAFVADPQLVDPHTYPGRPWPLSTLTIWYTDVYLKRVYTLMQERLYPDTTIFLGDLFDGGREWSVRGGQSWDNPDKEFKRYGEAFWIKEYKRFSAIFFETFSQTGVAPREGQTDRRRLISSLPGNHDLGFANGVHKPVRNRFHAYFGEGNRVDVVGNHSVVSIDGVSLSAKDHTESRNEDIWKPTMDFLDSVQEARKTAIAEELRYRYGVDGRPRYNHSIVETDQLRHDVLPPAKNIEETSFPTILLTHVPLYRDAGTPCGPLREHWPPSSSSDGKPLEHDDRNAISISAGYQYQNVLSFDLTKDVTTKIGDIQYAFSGDDHDYCEVVHRRYPSGGGGIREVTAKSLSWAMGVRKPGFVVLSLWNPIDANGKPLQPVDATKGTLQSHLCLMPDQLGIFIRYAMLLSLTLSLLLLRAGHMAANPQKSQFAGSDSPLLPTTRIPDIEKAESSSSDDGLQSSSERGKLASRATTSRNRSVSPLGGYGLPPPANPYSIPLVAHAGYYGPPVDDEERKAEVYVEKRRYLKGLALFYAEFKWSIIKVAYVVLGWYGWLLWHG
jgi:ethanolamine phosphate phosphodiesterase